MKPSLLTKKPIPAFVQRHWQIWLCVLCFVIPFLLAGAGGWFWVEASYDHLGQLTSDKEYKEACKRVEQESIAAFVHDGLLYGYIGLGMSVAFLILLRLGQQPATKDELH